MSKIFVVDSNTLYSTNDKGEYTTLTGGWSGVQCMTTCNGFVYIIDNATLYKVNPDSGEYTELTGGWINTRMITSAFGKLFMIDGTTMYSADPDSGEYTELSSGWDGPLVMAALT